MPAHWKNSKKELYGFVAFPVTFPPNFKCLQSLQNKRRKGEANNESCKMPKSCSQYTKQLIIWCAKYSEIPTFILEWYFGFFRSLSSTHQHHHFSTIRLEIPIESEVNASGCEMRTLMHLFWDFLNATYCENEICYEI